MAAQVPALELRAGVLASSTLVEDLLATPALRQQYASQLGESPRARAAAAPLLELGLRLPLRPRMSLGALLGWQPTRLEVEDAGGTREAQDVSVVHGQVEIELRPRAPLLVTAGVGLLAYRAPDEGLFAGGADVSPLVRLGVGAALPLGRHRGSLRALGEYHRFGTASLRAAGGSSGGVLRYGLEAGFAWGGAR